MTAEQTAQLENEKRAAKAYARGFITHAMAGLGKTQEQATNFYKLANTIFHAQQEKFAAIRNTILSDIAASKTA